jgi:hypothetical protein
MVRRKWLGAMLAVLVLLSLIFSGSLPLVSRSAGEQNPPADSPPTDGAAPDRWREIVGGWKAEAKHDPADNSFCYVCHLNYEEEKLVKKHVKAGVGCETCHGISDKHSEDEDGVTPPDIMFAAPRVRSFCLECHPQEKLLDVEDHADVFRPEAETSPDKVCTECHAKQHRLAVRTRKWDKVTGKLIWDDGVRMMTEKPE